MRTPASASASTRTMCSCSAPSTPSRVEDEPANGRRRHGTTTPAPQSKPVTLASRLVAQDAPLVAFGLGLRIPAAGPVVIDSTPNPAPVGANLTIHQGQAKRPLALASASRGGTTSHAPVADRAGIPWAPEPGSRGRPRGEHLAG